MSIRSIKEKSKKLVSMILCGALMMSMTVVSLPEKVSAATNAKIHFITINDNNNAIVLECNGRFGIVDSGEDTDRPSGKNKKYPLRSGISAGGYEDQVIDYMISLGMNSSNVDFYIGTHAHSDHIGSADEVIYQFRPERVYIGTYDDSMITSSSNLWDNQYVYDNMIKAAKAVGATIIQEFDDADEDGYANQDFVASEGNAANQRSNIMILWSGDDGLDAYRPKQVKVKVERRKADSSKIEDLIEESLEEALLVEDGSDAMLTDEENIITDEEIENDDNCDEEELLIEEITDDNINTEDLLIEESTVIPEEETVLDSEKSDNSVDVEDIQDNQISDSEGEETVTEVEYTEVIEEEYVVEESYVIPEETSEVYTINLAESGWETLASCTLTADEKGVYSCQSGVDNYEEGYEYRIVCDDIPNYTVKVNNEDFTIQACLNGSEETVTEEGANVTPLGKGASTFTLGSGMTITIMNTEAKRDGVPDANYSSWGVLVEANGKRAFLGGDINNYNGSEDRLLKQLGHVDLLNLGHHGYYGSSSNAFVTGLNPSKIVLCSPFKNISNSRQYNGPGVLDTLIEMGKKGSTIYATGQYADRIGALVFKFDSKMSNNIPNVYTIGTTWPESTSTKSILLKQGKLCSSYFGFVKNNGIWKFFENSYIATKSKWVLDKGTYYYLDDKDNYATGWKKINGLWYHFQNSGKMDSNLWIKDAGLWYYVKPSGAMAKGWQKVDGKWYYLHPSGAMAVGWLKLDDRWYYLEWDGAMARGWKYISGSYYYFVTEGLMATGWHKINNKWYYFFETSGKMAANTWIGNDYVNSNGAWVKSR